MLFSQRWKRCATQSQAFGHSGQSRYVSAYGAAEAASFQIPEYLWRG
jgi:hypothetical protein